jgi:hypothetical protein
MNSVQSMCQRAGRGYLLVALALAILCIFQHSRISTFSARTAMKKLLEYELSNLHRTDFAARFSRKSGFPDTASHHLNEKSPNNL